MRFNYDLLPGERLTFEEIARRYALQYVLQSITPGDLFKGQPLTR